jgi:hypothetical protein
MLNLVEQLKVVEGLVPQVGAAAIVTSDYVSVKNLHRLFAVIHYNQGDADNQQWNVMRSPLVSGVGAVALAATALCRIWSNLDCATSDLLVERTAAINYASGAGATHKQIVIEIDPAELGAGYDCVAIATNAAVAATSWVEIMFYGVPRYAGQVANQPTLITD